MDGARNPVLSCGLVLFIHHMIQIRIDNSLSSFLKRSNNKSPLALLYGGISIRCTIYLYISRIETKA